MKKEFDISRLPMIMAIMMVVVVVFISLGIPLIDAAYNNYKHGEFMESDELKCKQFCDPEEYYFSGGGFFGGDICGCKGKVVNEG